jgi:hypothetical protein
VIVLWGYSRVSSQSSFVDRYVITALPPVALLAAEGIVGLTRRRRVAAFIVLLVLLVFADVRWYRSDPKEDWRDATAVILAGTRAGDGVVFAAGYTRVPFEYYAERRPGAARPAPLYPAVAWTRDVRALGAPTTSQRAAARASTTGVRRLWLVLSNHDPDADGAAGTPAAETAFWVPPGWAETQDHRYFGVDVRLYTAGGPPSLESSSIGAVASP